jgi:hypothetical protein
MASIGIVIMRLRVGSDEFISFCGIVIRLEGGLESIISCIRDDGPLIVFSSGSGIDDRVDSIISVTLPLWLVYYGFSFFVTLFPIVINFQNIVDKLLLFFIPYIS